MRASFLVQLFAVCSLASTSACSCDAGVDDTGGDGGAGGSSNNTNGGANQGGSTSDVFEVGGGGGGCPTRCSSDLHSVIDCEGNLVETCPPELGCGAEGCVPACESATQNKSSIGCDYYSVAPDVIADGAGACFAAFIANTWGSPLSISVERAGQTYDVSQFARIPSGSGQSLTYAPLPGNMLPPGEVAILFLARFGATLTDCPPGITPALTSVDAAVHGTGLGDAFHITTSAPVVAYDVFPFGGGQSAATSATLLLPTSVWSDNYIGVTAFRKSLIPQAQPSMDIVAAEDGTTVTILPTQAIVGGPSVPAGAAGVPISYTINRGQILQFTQDTELTGSPIQSDKPIGVWGAATCLSVDVGQIACDSAHQQIPPITALGSEYAGVRYRNRFPGQEETPPWRMVGAVDGTVLSWEPSIPPGAPTTLSVGQLAEFRAAGPFVVKSQDEEHPFYMSAYMTGCAETNPAQNDCRGDPEYVNVVPSDQFLSSYTFFTDPTYPETNLVVTRRRTPDGFKDVTLDCLGTLSGWLPVGSSGEYEQTYVDLVTGNFMPVSGCDNGRHEMSSDAPFGLAVWGWGSAVTGGIFGFPDPQFGFYSQAVSYAYPAGASVQPINTVVVPPVPR